MKIRITGIPGGNHPEWVRTAWIGITLTSFGCEHPNGSNEPDSKRDSRKNLGGYQVQGDHALDALGKHNDAAYTWWCKNRPDAAFGTFIFHDDVCEIIPGSKFPDDDIPF